MKFTIKTRRVMFVALAITMLALEVAAQKAHAASVEDLALEVEMLRGDLGDLSGRMTDGITLHGYYDFEYLNDNRAGSPSAFRQHHISIFPGKEWGKWRFLSEVEFEDGVQIEGDGVAPAEARGGIKVEFGWLEYMAADALTLRMGKFMLPHYWNVNHYPSIVLSTNRPLMVRNLFPTDLAGVMAYGSLYGGALGITYNLYAGNGQSPNPYGGDDNEHKATGGHLTFHLGGLTGLFSRFDIGGGAYSDRTVADGAFDVWGADAQINIRRLELLAEYASRTANDDIEGFYAQPAYRLFGEVRAFYRYGALESATDTHTRQIVGLNFRPRPEVSLKLEYNTNTFDDPATEEYEQVAVSIAVFM